MGIWTPHEDDDDKCVCGHGAFQHFRTEHNDVEHCVVGGCECDDYCEAEDEIEQAKAERAGEWVSL